MNHKVFLFAVVLMALAIPQSAKAQTWNQATACPGWNNPVSFTAGNSTNYYQGRGGVKNSNMFNVMTGETGVTWSNTIYTAAQMQTLSSGCSGSVPNSDRLFAIMTTVGQSDANTGYHLQYVPTQ